MKQESHCLLAWEWSTHWRFKTPEIAKKSADTIYKMFLDYKKEADFVGMDMARKFLQMGWTRSRRYANHKSGRKYSHSNLDAPKKIGDVPDYKDEKNKLHYIKTQTKKTLPLNPDPEKAHSAQLFYEKYQSAKNDPIYLEMKAEHQAKFER